MFVGHPPASLMVGPSAPSRRIRRRFAVNLWPMKSRAGKLIEEAVNAEEWTSARRLIKVELRSKPKDYWLLSRLALTYDEQRKHRHSLYWDAMALQVAPTARSQSGVTQGRLTCWAVMENPLPSIAGC